MTSPWGTPQEPQSGDRFREADAWNRRLLLRPIEYIPDIKKLDTRGDALKLNVVDLDDAAGPKLYESILWFSGPLIGVFKGSIGTPFIGFITKEKNTNGYMAWKFYDLQTDADTDRAAQAYLAAHPEFLAPIQAWGAAPSTAHHEQGPAPDWAGAVPAAPPTPPRPGGPVSAPPGPPPAPRPAPGFPSAPGGPPVPNDPSDIMARLRRTAEGMSASGGNVGGHNEDPPF